MLKKEKIIYYAHSMEGKEIPRESGRRPLAARKLLPGFTILVPEEWQDTTKYEEIYETDIKHLKTADIVIVDLYDIGLEKNDGIIQCQGTLMETGYAMAKKKFIVVITRNTKRIHPFYLGMHKVVNSLDEACEYIERTF